MKREEKKRMQQRRQRMHKLIPQQQNSAGGSKDAAADVMWLLPPELMQQQQQSSIVAAEASSSSLEECSSSSAVAKLLDFSSAVAPSRRDDSFEEKENRSANLFLSVSRALNGTPLDGGAVQQQLLALTMKPHPAVFEPMLPTRRWRMPVGVHQTNKNLLPVGLVEYLGTDALTHPYVNPATPSPPSSPPPSAAAAAAGSDDPQRILSHLCDVSMSSMDKSHSSSSSPWSLLNNIPLASQTRAAGGRVASSSSSCSSSSSSVVRTLNEPFSFVQLSFYNVALDCTHYAITLPGVSTTKQQDEVWEKQWSAEEEARAQRAAALFGSPKKRLQAAPRPSSRSSSTPAPVAYPCSWRLEGSNAGVQWTVLDEQWESDELREAAARGKGAERRVLFEIKQTSSSAAAANTVSSVAPSSSSAAAASRRFTLFRLTQTGCDSLGGSSSHVLSLAGLELYGSLSASISDAEYLASLETAQLSHLRATLLAKGDTFTLPTESGRGITPGLDVPLSEGGRVVINRGSAKWRFIRVEREISLSSSSSSSSRGGSNNVNGVFQCSFRILSSPPTSNSWSICVGIVTGSFDRGGSSARCWIGAQPSSWGYIGGMGGVCNESGTSSNCQSNSDLSHTLEKTLPASKRCDLAFMHAEARSFSHSCSFAHCLCLIVCLIVLCVPDGSPYGAGDLVGLRVDLRLGTLEFLLNGVSQGVAFRNLESCMGPFYPAVSMHAVRAQVQYIPMMD